MRVSLILKSLISYDFGWTNMFTCNLKVQFWSDKTYIFFQCHVILHCITSPQTLINLQIPTSPQLPNHVQNSTNQFGDIQKSLLNKTMAFVLFVFHWNKRGNVVAADISLLCKCSFPHKQRGVQNSRVERVESIVCVCVCVLSIAQNHLGKVLCMYAQNCTF